MLLQWDYWGLPVGDPNLGLKPFTTIFDILFNQVNVAQEQLPAFLKTAEKLKIKGLAEGTQGAD